MEVLLDNSLARIHEQNNYICLIDGFECFYNGELLDSLFNIFASPNTRRIDQGVSMPMTLKLDKHTVASRTGLIEYNHPFFAE